MNSEDYEKILGPADDFIASMDVIETLRKWAVSKGFLSVTTAPTTDVIKLANLYHELGPQSKKQGKIGAPNLSQQEAADIIMRVVQAMDGLTALQALRNIIYEEIPTTDQLREIAKAVYDDLPARKLEVITANGSIILNGLRHHMTERVMKICGLGHNIMLVGPAGCGKTTIGENIATAFNMPFFITSTVQDTHELIGFIDGYGKYKSTPFRYAFQNGGIWVADEIDAWDAGALLVANSALANGFATFPDSDNPVRRHSNFRVIATANTFGTGADRVYVGRNELDAASLDRFAMIEIDYDEGLERSFANGNPVWLERVRHIRRRVKEKRIRHVVSSRAIIMGAQALQIGIPKEDVEDIYLFKGMSKTDREKIGE